MKRNIAFHILYITLSISICCHSAYAADLVKIHLPKGVFIELPTDWLVLSDDQLIRLNKLSEQGYSYLNLSRVLFQLSEFPFAANYYYNNFVVGLVNIRYYPYLEITQDEARESDDIQLKLLDEILYTQMLRDFGASNNRMFLVSWGGTKKISINGATIFLTEYRRAAQTSQGTFRVRLARVFNGDKSFTLTVSYHESAASFMQPMTDRIINSLTISE